MKKYKSNYIFTFYNFLFTLLPGWFILWLSTMGSEGVVNIFLMYIVLLLFVLIFGNTVHFLICLFTEHKVYIDEETITLKGKKILTESMKTKDVGLIVFDPGMIKRFGGNIPCSLTLINHDDTESLNINHPSFFMILEIKKQCKKAKFKFDNLKWHIIWCGVFIALCTIISLLD